jgi:hypothetical protein
VALGKVRRNKDSLMGLHKYKGIVMSSSETFLMLDQEGFIGWKHKIFLKSKSLHNQW